MRTHYYRPNRRINIGHLATMLWIKRNIEICYFEIELMNCTHLHFIYHKMWNHYLDWLEHSWQLVGRNECRTYALFYLRMPMRMQNHLDDTKRRYWIHKLICTNLSRSIHLNDIKFWCLQKHYSRQLYARRMFALVCLREYPKVSMFCQRIQWQRYFYPAIMKLKPATKHSSIFFSLHFNQFRLMNK